MAEPFGELLRRLRVAASLTQEAMAERCRISADTIAALEQGRRRAPRLSTVDLIANALELLPADRALLAAAAAGARPTANERGQPLGSDGSEAGREPAATGTARGDRARPGARLPVPLTPLVGRQAASDAVAQALSSERLVTLIGPGGVGKTRLALAVANQVLHKFAGGAWWVELGPVEDPDKVPDALLRSLGASEQPNVPIGEQAAAALPEAPVLLVFDNCEHVLDAVANLVAELLAHLSITVLATSRQNLGIPGEVRWPVPALAVPARATPVDELADIDSVQLLVERAKRAHPQFALTEANAEAAVRICRRLEGIPLAIELAAARANVQALGQLADELEDRVPLTASAARGVPARHSTLLACVDWSYRLLNDEERAAFWCLAAFPGSFSSEAFCSVADRSTSPRPGSATTSLSYLTEKSLVSADPTNGRFRTLETIRVFASDRADEASELEAIRDAHAQYFSSWLSALGVADATNAVLDHIETEYANIRAALVWSIERRSPRAAAIVADIGVAWHQQNRFHDARVLGDGALAVTAGSDQPGWARAVAALGPARALSGDASFRSTISEADAIARKARDLLAEGQCKLTQGYGAPFDTTQLVGAYELGLAAPSNVLAGVAAAALASGGTDDRRDDWLKRAGEIVGQFENSTVRANFQLAQADSLMERGRMQEALDLCVAAAQDNRVMPATRLLGIGRALQVALYRADLSAEELASRLTDELSDVWPVGGSWLSSAWTAFGRVMQFWSALLRGEGPPTVSGEDLKRMTRLAVTPSVVRSVCRAAIEQWQRPDASAWAQGVVPPGRGSLMAASVAAVEAVQAAVDGDDGRAAQHWLEALRVAAANQWRLLACDALEGLACIASRKKDAIRAGELLTAAQACRQGIDYRYRSGFEQEQVDQAWATVASAGVVPAPLPWATAVSLALAP